MATEDRNNTGGGGRQTWANIAKIGFDRSIREGRPTWCHLFDLKSAAVMAETDPDKIADNLEVLKEICQLWRNDIEVHKQMGDQKKCIARVFDNGDNMYCDQPIENGVFCETHSLLRRAIRLA